MTTNISWTDEVWNPVTGCSRVSEGCRNCYAAKLAPRLAGMGQKGYTKLPWTARNATQNVFLHADRLDKPLGWKKPRRIFVNSMSDLFHELVPFEFIGAVFGVMAAAPNHTFQVLTKRPERMVEFFTWVEERYPDLFPFGEPQYPMDANAVMQFLPPDLMTHVSADDLAPPWPLPNVWLGTSVEDQRAADERIPHLLRTPAAVRFLSCEPLIGPVNITDQPWWDWRYTWDFYKIAFPDAGPPIHWVIAGGESGPNHRPLDHAWMRSLRDQTQAAGVPFWAKQDSGLRSETVLPEDLQIRQMPESREWRRP